MGEADAKGPRVVRPFRDVLAWTAFLIAAVALASRYLPVVSHASLIIGAASPYLMLSAPVAAALFLRNRRRWPAVLALLVFTSAAISQAPQFLAPDDAPDPSIPIRVLTANLRDGKADPESVAKAAQEHADLLLVQELSPQLAEVLDESYLHSDFPYSALHPGHYASGVGIWSRYPIVQTSLLRGFALGGLTATVRAPGAASDVIVATVHLVGPWPQPVDEWGEEIAALPETLDNLAAAADPGAVIVGGDLNATAEMHPFRALLDTGFHDAGRQFGFAATWPANLWLPPVIRIDHILTYRSTAANAYAVRIDGSDHLGLGATVFVPG